ncbi:energy-coupling factor transporter transmembrane component T [Evansella cellulosilytica]|uniref:Cobalt transport protein n=1 Tax=Evansella cellulosilytica (strain ATCC 21833 / DSM 2522 / FERM P-1141 / JCM 9156 / N-4) TaxID=649639 RepID=E6TX21_EVAC2|nr:energy-coupling factor transporter transmembrane component T [Evansella cellulosilytica]ADU31110.1 cobalt transport protein [Evansella cellulosilytica DSM 2522]
MINRFEHFHPFVTFFYYAGVIILLMVYQHPTVLGAAFILILLVNYAQDRLRGFRKWAFFIIISGALIIILNPVFNERGQHILFEVFGHRITLEAVVNGSITALTIMCVISLFISYNEVMTPNKLLYLFARFLPQFAVLLMLTLRFIPLMKRRLDDISVVQQSKGIFVNGGRWRDRVKNGLLYVQALLTFSLEEAIQTADSMKAREYGKHKRSSYEHFRFKRMDYFLLISLILFLTICIIGRINGYLHLKIYPVMDSLFLSHIESFYFFCFVIFLSIPLLIEVGGKIRWRLLK